MDCPLCYRPMAHVPHPDDDEVWHCTMHGHFNMTYNPGEDASADEDEILRLMEE